MLSLRMVFVVNNSDYFVSHRIGIGLKLLSMGYEVHIIAPGPAPKILSEKGFLFHDLEMSRKGKNPLNEVRALYALYCLFKKINPDFVHLVTIKPYLYGGVAARLAGVPGVISAVAGLGILFSQNDFKSRLLRGALYPLYRLAFSHSNQKVIFQNRHDMELLQRFAGLAESNSILIRGAGVDLHLYPYVPEPEGMPVVSLASRLLKDKGVLEFVEASRILQQRGVMAEFWLIGAPDPGNANTISQGQLEKWEQAGLVKCFGYRADIAKLFSMSHIVALPSYYGEGLPKVLIEAAACGRAVVTTDHPGCRDAIGVDETGFLVPIKDSAALADALAKLIQNATLRKEMGLAGRRMAEDVFDVEKVVEAHMRVYEEVLGVTPTSL